MSRSKTREPLLTLYRNHDRELLFHGTVIEARAAGIGLLTKTAPWRVRFGTVCYKVVNQHFPTNGDVQLWLSSEARPIPAARAATNQNQEVQS